MSPFNQSHLSVWSIFDFVSLFLCLPTEVFWSQKYTQIDEGRKQREREDGEDRENCRTEGDIWNQIMIYCWRGGIEECFCLASNTVLFIGWRKNKLAEGRDEKQNCVWVMGGKKKRLVKQALEGHVVATKFKKKMLEEKDTLTKMKTKISKYQKLKTKKDTKQQTERKALVQTSDLSRISSALHFTSCQTFSILVRTFIILIFI